MLRWAVVKGIRMSTLTLSPTETKLFEIFLPYAFDEIIRVAASDMRFVHYTSAEAALSIIQTSQVWMRNASCMDDFMEVQYGLDCLFAAMRAGLAKRFKSALDGLFDGFSAEFDPLFTGWSPRFQQDTYLTCISAHDPEENDYGRLSMWRAFGQGTRVALVFNNTPFFAQSDVLKVYSSPVAYLSPARFAAEMERVVAGIEANLDFLRDQGHEEVQGRLFNAFRFAALCTKHPGFREEREWRLIHSPAMHPSEHLEREVKLIRGTPQTIYKIPLRNFPDDGLTGAELPQLLERVIIGPTQFPAAVSEVFEKQLEDAGVQNARAKISVSDIPLRGL